MSPATQGPAYACIHEALTVAKCGPPQGSGWKCPAHPDSKPSLSVTPVPGKVLIKCHAGCATEDVVAALRLSIADLYDEPALATKNPSTSSGNITYPYHDEDGTLLYQVIRTPDKKFTVRRPIGNGEWEYNLKGVKRVPYRLPEVIKATGGNTPIFIVEGEKDVETLRKRGCTATCNFGGAGKWHPDFAKHLQGATEVFVIADRDPAGYDHARGVVASLKSAGITCTVLESAHGSDVTDHLNAGAKLEDLVAIDLDAKPTKKKPEKDNTAKGSALSATPAPLELVPIGEWLKKPIEDTKWLVDGLLPVGGTSILVGKPKAGKSTLARHLAWCVATETPWLDRSVASGEVVYLALEGREADHIDHFRAMGISDETAISFYHGHGEADLLEKLKPAISGRRPVLLIVDTMQRLLRITDGNAYAETSDAFDPILALAKETGTHIMLIHHMRKGRSIDIDGVLGSTAIAGSADSVIFLELRGHQRLLSSRQRVGPDIDPPMSVEMNSESGVITSTGTLEETKAASIEDKILEFLRDAGGWVTRDEILNNVVGKAKCVGEALTMLVAMKRIYRCGSGVKGSPHRYTGFDEVEDPDNPGTKKRVPWYPEPEASDV